MDKKTKKCKSCINLACVVYYGYRILGTVLSVLAILFVMGAMRFDTLVDMNDDLGICKSLYVVLGYIGYVVSGALVIHGITISYIWSEKNC